jgi:hypothetical protein
MTADDRSRELPLQQLDALTPEQARRFQLWRAMAELAKAQEDGRLSPEQARLLSALADNLQQLSTQLHELAALGQQCAQLLESDRASTASAPSGPDADQPQGRLEA